MAAGRQQKIAEEIRLAIGEALIRDELKDPRVRGAGIITVTHVSVTGDLHQARALFMVYGADEAKLKEVKTALNKASGFWRHKIGERLRVKFTPTVTFEVDRVFETEARIERTLRDIADADAARLQAEAEEAQASEGGPSAEENESPEVVDTRAGATHDTAAATSDAAAATNDTAPATHGTTAAIHDTAGATNDTAAATNDTAADRSAEAPGVPPVSRKDD